MAPSQLVVLLLGVALGADVPADFTLPAPPGPFLGPPKANVSEATNFKAGSPVVATSYFYWYDCATKVHLVNGDGTDALTDHPRTLQGLSYHNVDWHAGELDDMIDAGIDVALPVYWGVPYTAETWSDQGVPKLVAARQRLLGQGKTPPAIGLFYDTSTLRHNGKHYHVDLTTAAGRLWFYGTIRNFFSQVPSSHRARIDGRPLVYLYSPAFAKEVDTELFPALRRMFRADFGCDLYLVKMQGWPGEADGEYQWGAALAPRILQTAAVGPGYDHSAVPGRAPLVRARDEGGFYRFSWQRLLSMDPVGRPWLVHVETWNEFHEGTEICETLEYGRQYIELTRRFADKFHAREQVEMTRVPSASATPDKSDGLKIAPKPEGDGPIRPKTIEGKAAWSTAQNRHSPVNRYMYFDVGYEFLCEGDEPVEVTIGYFDAGPKEFCLEYDSSDPSLQGVAQRFCLGHCQAITGSKTWKEVTLVIEHARFAGRANGSDFRLACAEADLSVSHVSLRRPRPE